MYLTPATLLLSVTVAIGSTTSAIWATDTVQEQSSVTEKTTATGDPTIIQHIDSKMEPTVVQSRVSTDPATGEKQKVVEPLIMERHEKVLDTTIVQPEMTETKTTTQQMVESKDSRSLPTAKPVAARSHTSKCVSHRHYVGTHKAIHSSRPKSAAVSSKKAVVQTTEIIRQSKIKETFIQAPTDNSPPPTPQVIQKTEDK
jgi:hypothetical protein